MGKIVLEDFNEGNGYYKINLAYLNKEQVEEIEAIVSKWNPTDEDIKSCIAMCLTDANEQRFKDYGTNLKDCLAWLEKQGKNNMGISETTKKELEHNLNKALAKETPESWNEFLEKQGEQKPVEKVKPKFKDCDWIIFSGLTLYIEEVVKGFYGTISKGGIRRGYDWSIDNEARLWTIQDAKDGDMLREDSCTFIIERMKNDGTAIIHCCLFDDGDFGTGSTLCFDVDSTYPATKEQRDLLFQKMKEAGYEWDAEKKELRKIEQKPNWSEEDERMCQETIDWFEKKCFPYALEEENPAKDSIKWLKSLKDRVQPQWKPSEEQIKDFGGALLILKLQHYASSESLESLYEQLKKL